MDELPGQPSDELLGKTSDKLLGKTSDELLGKTSDELLGKISDELLGKTSDELLGKTSVELLGKALDELLGKSRFWILSRVSGLQCLLLKGIFEAMEMQNVALNCISRILSTFAVFMYTPEKSIRGFADVVEVRLRLEKADAQTLSNLLWALSLSQVRDATE